MPMSLLSIPSLDVLVPYICTHKFAVVHFQVAKCHIKLELKNDSFTELRGEIIGPPDTPYEGATFILDIKIPETYPFNPPKVEIKMF